MFDETICPPIPSTTTTSHPPPTTDVDICASATLDQKGITVAGGNKQGSELNQLIIPYGLFIDDNNAIYVADTYNHRVVKWESGASTGVVVAGGNEKGSQSNQLNVPSSVVVNKNGTIFICDRDNRRVQQWLKNDHQGQTFISDISCFGLAIDNNGSLYVSDVDTFNVTKWPGDQIVAGENGQGTGLNQLTSPWHLFVDRNQSVFVADIYNSRVMKWPVGSSEGLVVAGGNGPGDSTNQLKSPVSVIVDQMGTVYVLEYGDRGVMRWFKDMKAGNIIIRGLIDGMEVAHFDLALDRYGNLYVADGGVDRIQMFAIDKSSCLTSPISS